MKFEWETKRIGFRIIFNKPVPILKDGFEIVLFPPKGLSLYNLILPYRYKRER